MFPGAIHLISLLSIHVVVIVPEIIGLFYVLSVPSEKNQSMEKFL